MCLHVPVHFPPFLGVMKTSKARLQGAHLGPVAHGAHGPVGTDVGPPGKVNRWVRWPNVATPRIIPIFTRNGWTFLDVSLFCYWPCSFSTFTGAYRFGKARSRRGLRRIPQFLVSRMPSHPKGQRGWDQSSWRLGPWGGPSSPSKTWLPALPVFLVRISTLNHCKSEHLTFKRYIDTHTHTDR